MPGWQSLFKKPRIIYIIEAAVVIVILAAAVYGLMIAQAAPPQPFPYSHSIHIQKGISCLFCHSEVYRGESAGLPTKQKCLGCHNNIKPDTPALQQFDAYAKSHDTFEWVPVAIMPDFVYFSHQPHLNAGLDCKNCHGDLSQMTTAQPQRGWTMGWCLSCHKTMAPDKFVKLSDCATCHK